MATIKAIEGRTIHQIQSGQVIVDLCSVVKELVENSLDAGATSIEVRFRNHGLDSIEVQDNGGGIASEDYETIALKHHTSKLSDYSDLSSLDTFGFRGEALSSLCAVSNFSIVTARADEVPKGSKLEFESSGKLKGTQVVASQRGTSVLVEKLFHNLPVRRRELDKNIKREYGKVLGLLHAYACISTGLNKKAIVFATKSNPSTKENIANVFGTKALATLVPLDLTLELQPSHTIANQEDRASREVQVAGHISRPVYGEGRQALDRQMFFVNGRPCGLPQVSKAINEVYKSYNLAQSPFIFADFRMDTNSYDINVSPDKRTILLHDQSTLLENLKASLTELFDGLDQTIPQSQTLSRKPPQSTQSTDRNKERSEGNDTTMAFSDAQDDRRSIQHNTKQEDGADRLINDPPGSDEPHEDLNDFGETKSDLSLLEDVVADEVQTQADEDLGTIPSSMNGYKSADSMPDMLIPVRELNQPVAGQEIKVEDVEGDQSQSEIVQDEWPIPAIASSTFRGTSGVVQNAFDRMRPRRAPAETATVTIGSKTTTLPMATPSHQQRRPGATKSDMASPKIPASGSRHSPSNRKFARGLRAFAAPGTKSFDTNSIEEVEGSDGSQSSATPSSPWHHSSPPLLTDNGSHGDPESLVEKQAEGMDIEQDITEKSSTSDEVDQSDDEYIDEADRKAKDELQVDQLIRQAEADRNPVANDESTRANTLFSAGSQREDSTLYLTKNIDTSSSKINSQLSTLRESLQIFQEQTHNVDTASNDALQAGSVEEKLSLTVSKDDFAGMRIVGQFNLGFILATRPVPSDKATATQNTAETEDLFIIDQHASDEKYNFERLQAQTVVQNQRLVQPRTLDLTAIEEEIIMDHTEALVKNGFIIDVDTTGAEPVGRRCQLMSLPMSREVVFDIRDLEELLSLLADSSTSSIPRPSKVRRMFAMRACRSSVMIGRTMTPKQMSKIVRHMGEIEKPWNCPHGRPTMRHLLALGAWESWNEGDGDFGFSSSTGPSTDWAEYIS
ncbi:MAG: hypothetical protein M1837_003848 [Sclerophora amabilis]|nr:MAG: hypothetical protein M1837_003848 [Sclerophora amabilis]